VFSFLPKPIIGVINIIFCALNLLFCSVLVYIIAFFKLFSWGNYGIKLFDRLGTLIAQLFTFNNWWFFKITTRMRYEIQGVEKLKHNNWYLLAANHQSWADILVLEHAFAFKIPMLKFFMKKELLWVPLVGSSCWVLNFPFMKRYSREFLEKNPHLKGQDLETTKKSCERFKFIPSTMINFIEGTRFTQEKYQAQASPYDNLLKPKAGGAAFILEAMGDILKEMLDVTIVYPPSQHIAWDYFCGRFMKVVVDINVIEIDGNLRGDYIKDADFKIFFQNWLNQVWQQKDQRITEIKAKLNAEKN